uniref:ZU5 domain-containing protein n=1 Tax=Parascaris equorum TaxID=6256 RepID=A0A914S594_PAREQ
MYVGSCDGLACRGRWTAGSYNERRLGPTPVHGQPLHSLLDSSPATSSPLHTESIVNNAVPDTVTEHEKREATVIEHVSQVVDSNGCTLSCPESGVMLIIPKGAIDEGVQQEIYVKVCRANCDESRPPLDESRGESLMSPLVMCGPQDLHFNVPVELRLPHSASNNGENWSFALKSGTGEQWNQIALDGNNTSLVTDKFASVKICHF